jgi:hypothetical protein
MKKLVSLIIIALVVIIGASTAFAAPIEGVAIGTSAPVPEVPAGTSAAATTPANTAASVNTTTSTTAATAATTTSKTNTATAATSTASSNPALSANSTTANSSPTATIAAIGTSDRTPLETIIAWVSTAENKKSLIKLLEESKIDTEKDEKWSWVNILLNAAIEFAPASVTTAPSNTDPSAKPTTTPSPTTAKSTEGTHSTDEQPEHKPLVTLTKPVKEDDKQTVTYENFLVCGKVASQQVNVTLAMYDSGQNEYVEIKFAKDKKGARIYFNLFAEELKLKKGRNRVKVVAYTKEAEDKPVLGENLQLLYFDVYYIDRNIINADRDITDYFSIPSSGELNFDLSRFMRIE